METQDRYSVLVHHVRIDLTIAIVAGDHLATASKAHHGSPILPVVFLETLSITTLAVEPFDAPHNAEIRSAAASTAELDVIAARKVQFLVVQPPRHVEMHPADAIFVMGDTASHLRNVAAYGQA